MKNNNVKLNNELRQPHPLQAGEVSRNSSEAKNRSDTCPAERVRSCF